MLALQSIKNILLEHKKNDETEEEAQTKMHMQTGRG